MRASPGAADTSLILANLQRSAGWDRVMHLSSDFDTAEPETIRAILQEASRFAEGTLVGLNDSMDRHGCTLADGRVHTAPGHKAAWQAFVAGGWTTLGQPAAQGGQSLPTAVWTAAQSLFERACPAFGMLSVPQNSAAKLIAAWGSPELQQEWLPQLADGAWGATICLSEPEAGSDANRISTRARPDTDGTWRVTGEKCWISFGDHDLTPRIGHCVLAKTQSGVGPPDELSLFLVPDWFEEAGAWARNGVFVRRIEEKMGLHGSPTCVLGFEDARGFLLGDLDRGLAQMFVMIANMRLAVGNMGVGIASACTDIALRYAAERHQGGARTAMPLPIAAHADVQRMLFDMRARTELLRGLVFTLANMVDIAALEPEPVARAEAAALAQWLLPIVKTAGAETGFHVASQGVQVLGGAGYTRDWPIEQALRDARVLAVFEGTSGIQALDLLHRRLLRDGGATLALFLRRVRDDAACSLAIESVQLRICADQIERVGKGLQAMGRRDAEAGASVFLELASLTAFGWMAARLTAQPAATPVEAALSAAANFWLSQLAAKATALAAEALMTEAPLGAFKDLCAV